jgi:hypothetical protein
LTIGVNELRKPGSKNRFVRHSYRSVVGRLIRIRGFSSSLVTALEPIFKRAYLARHSPGGRGALKRWWHRQTDEQAVIDEVRKAFVARSAKVALRKGFGLSRLDKYLLRYHPNFAAYFPFFKLVVKPSVNESRKLLEADVIKVFRETSEVSPASEFIFRDDSAPDSDDPSDVELYLAEPTKPEPFTGPLEFGLEDQRHTPETASSTPSDPGVIFRRSAMRLFSDKVERGISTLALLRRRTRSRDNDYPAASTGDKRRSQADVLFEASTEAFDVQAAGLTSHAQLPTTSELPESRPDTPVEVLDPGSQEGTRLKGSILGSLVGWTFRRKTQDILAEEGRSATSEAAEPTVAPPGTLTGVVSDGVSEPVDVHGATSSLGENQPRRPIPPTPVGADEDTFTTASEGSPDSGVEGLFSDLERLSPDPHAKPLHGGFSDRDNTRSDWEKTSSESGSDSSGSVTVKPDEPESEAEDMSDAVLARRLGKLRDPGPQPAAPVQPGSSSNRSFQGRGVTRERCRTDNHHGFDASFWLKKPHMFEAEFNGIRRELEGSAVGTPILDSLWARDLDPTPAGFRSLPTKPTTARLGDADIGAFPEIADQPMGHDRPGYLSGGKTRGPTVGGVHLDDLKGWTTTATKPGTKLTTGTFSATQQELAKKMDLMLQQGTTPSGRGKSAASSENLGSTSTESRSTWEGKGVKSKPTRPHLELGDFGWDNDNNDWAQLSEITFKDGRTYKIEPVLDTSLEAGRDDNASVRSTVDASIAHAAEVARAILPEASDALALANEAPLETTAVCKAFVTNCLLGWQFHNRVVPSFLQEVLHDDSIPDWWVSESRRAIAPGNTATADHSHPGGFQLRGRAFQAYARMSWMVTHGMVYQGVPGNLRSGQKILIGRGAEVDAGLKPGATVLVVVGLLDLETGEVWRAGTYKNPKGVVQNNFFNRATPRDTGDSYGSRGGNPDVPYGARVMFLFSLPTLWKPRGESWVHG